MTHWPALAVLVTTLLGAASASALEVETLRQAGPVDKRYNIAVLGDGYRAEDQAKLKTDAQGMIDYVFGVSPFEQYAQFFNVKLVHVISKDNGADGGTYPGQRDTALNTSYGCGGLDRSLCLPLDIGPVQAIALDAVPEVNLAIVIVNDPKYGGTGGPIAVLSANTDSFEVLAHELGHSLAGLADEYGVDDAGLTPCNEHDDCMEANVTLRSQRDQLKWKDWLEPGTPTPTPDTAQYASVVGLFEGARYLETGIYRPEHDCKMRDLGVAYCSVCTEQLIRAFWTADNIQMIEATVPAQVDVSSTTCDPIELSVTTPPITPSTYRYVWRVDGNLQTELTDKIVLSPRALMQGSHQVDVAVEDTTNLVRTDPQGVLEDHFAWTVSVTKDDCPIVSVAGAAPAPDSSGCACSLPRGSEDPMTLAMLGLGFAATYACRRSSRPS